MNTFPLLRLKKNQEKRLNAGHPWIFSNEIDVDCTPLQAFTAGDLVRVESAQGKTLGLAYVNPHTLLCARRLTSATDLVFDRHSIVQRLQRALHLRQQHLPQPFYRWVFGESDDLPGVVIDRYGNFVVIQITTAGMERLKSDLIAAVDEVIQPHGILWRNDSSSRALEGLAHYVEVAAGTIPEHINILENQAQFSVSVLKGQKTGWFFDHRANRAWVQKRASGKRILDLFSYVGSFSIQAAVAGAKAVYAVDSSSQAIAWLQENAKQNQVDERVHTEVADVTTALRTLHQQGEQFDLVLLDPPGFIKRRKDIKPGLKAYQRINTLAMCLVAPGGILMSSSCSLHCSQEMLTTLIAQSSQSCQRSTRIIYQGHQDLDHPVHPAILETNYLKTLACYVA